MLRSLKLFCAWSTNQDIKSELLGLLSTTAVLLMNTPETCRVTGSHKLLKIIVKNMNFLPQNLISQILLLNLKLITLTTFVTKIYKIIIQPF